MIDSPEVDGPNENSAEFKKLVTERKTYVTRSKNGCPILNTIVPASEYYGKKKKNEGIPVVRLTNECGVKSTPELKARRKVQRQAKRKGRMLSNSI